MNSEEAASSIDLAFLAALQPEQLRAVLPGFLAGFVAGEQASLRNRERMAALVADWSDDVCVEILALLAQLGKEHRLYPAHPACRVLGRAWSRDVLLSPRLTGMEHLDHATRLGPTLLVGNHLSYFDASSTDALVAWSGRTDLADRIVAAAGPKVYEDLFRLVAAACLNTLPVPQSTSFAHTAKLAPRELARKALESVESARTAMASGYVLLVYPEGSRSRTGHLGPFLKAVHRYLSCLDGLYVVPMAIVGTESMMPVSDHRVHPGPASLHFSAPLQVGPDGGAREVLELAHGAVAAMLPGTLRPPADAPPTA